MANYPDWVMVHKKKGTYINKVGDKYYLYAAHSERIPGTGKIRRVSDGYLGRITEKEGLIPPKNKVTGSVLSFEFGLSSLIFSLCPNIHKGLRKSFVIYGDFIFVASILSFIYGFFSEELFHHSWLSLHLPELNIPSPLTKAQENGIERGVRMIQDTMNRRFGSDLMLVRAAFSQIALVSINDRLYCCTLPDSITTLIQTYQLDWRPEQWQK